MCSSYPYFISLINVRKFVSTNGDKRLLDTTSEFRFFLQLLFFKIFWFQNNGGYLFTGLDIPCLY